MQNEQIVIKLTNIETRLEVVEEKLKIIINKVELNTSFRLKVLGMAAFISTIITVIFEYVIR
ncbi:MAG: hypothetical protein ACOYWZ_11115 [Bacillota bacterium]